MAGDWIKIEAATPSKPEIDLLAELLGISVNEVLGGLVRLWIWADQQTLDGNAVSVTKCAIDRHSGVTGLAQAMTSPRVNWLVERQDGGFSFPNFERHNGQTAKRRALTSKRVASCKKRKGNAEVTLGALPREEKRREDINPLSPPLAQGGNLLEEKRKKRRTRRRDEEPSKEELERLARVDRERTAEMLAASRGHDGGGLPTDWKATIKSQDTLTEEQSA